MIFNDVADDRSNNKDGAGRAVLRVYSVDYSAGATAAPGSCLPAWITFFWLVNFCML